MTPTEGTDSVVYLVKVHEPRLVVWRGKAAAYDSAAEAAIRETERCIMRERPVFELFWIEE
jgi:hypothetical protein